jgi:hypothetical protein
MEKLLPVCRRCHRATHKRRRQRPESQWCKTRGMTDEVVRCPRCEAAFIKLGPGVGRARSRATRDQGQADIFVCARCGEREALRESRLGEVIPFTEWPLSVDALLEEERLLIEIHRPAKRSSLEDDTR